MLPWRRLIHALLLPVLVGCAGTAGEDKFNPPPPKMTVRHPPPIRASNFLIPVTVRLDSALRKAEEKLPDSVGRPAYEEWLRTGGPDHPACGVECGILLKRGPLAIRTEGDSVEIAATLGYGFKCRKRIPCRGPKFTVGCGFEDEAPREARLRATGKFKLQNDWSLPIETRLDSLYEVTPCKVTFLKLNIAGLLLKKASEIYQDKASELDSLIEERIDLRNRMETVWKRLSTPIELQEKLFLDIRPRAISSSPPLLSDSTLHLTVGLTAHPAILGGAKPAETAVPLPDLSPPVGEEGFRLYVPIQLEFAEVDRRIRKRFHLDSGGMRFPDRRFFSVTVDKVELTGFGDSIMVKVHFHNFFTRGNAYMVGVPRFDPVTRMISVEKLDYTLETRGILVKTFSRLDHEGFKAKIQKLVTIPVGPQMADFRKKIEKALNINRERIRMSGKLGDFSLASVESDGERQALMVHMEATGTVTVKVE